MHDLLPDVVSAIGHALVHSTWQCALVGTLAALLLRMTRDASPQARYLIATLSMLLCVLLPILTALIALFPPKSPTTGMIRLRASSSLTTLKFSSLAR